MKHIQRDDIHIVSQHSNLTEEAIDQALKENVYHDKESWLKFLRLFLLSLGVGFTICGIVFFFAYNWPDLHKFVKIGLTEGLLVGTTVFALLPKINSTLKNIILTAAAALVGVLFAVFGQIYQTGANAYDFFLAWTIFITLWVLVSNFAVLWLFYLVLINTTLSFYADQVAHDWSETLMNLIHFLIYASVVILAITSKKIQVPGWFLSALTLASAGYATLGITEGIFLEHDPSFFILILTAAVAFTLAVWNGLKTKSLFYLSIVPFCLIIIISAALFKISHKEMMFLLVSLFIIGSVTTTIKTLITIQKKWAHEK